MKELSRLQKRVERMENALNRGREPQDPVDRFLGAMIGQEEKLYRQISNLRPFEEALDALWRACQTGGQAAMDAVWANLSEMQQTLVTAHGALHDHIQRRLEEPDLPEFDVSVWPEEVRKLVLEEAEE